MPHLYLENSIYMQRRKFLAQTLPLMTAPSLVIANNEINCMKKIQKPPRLKKGDTIGLIAPASSAKDVFIEKAVKNIENLGLNVKLGANIRAKNGYLAGTDAERLSDMHTMFADKTVSGVWCVRGGYGCSRLLEQIDYQLIRKNPKVMIGYSDITALHCALYEKAGLVTFHGSVGGSEFADYAIKHIQEMLFEPKLQHEIEYLLPDDKAENPIYKTETLREGKAIGRLAGGNLSLITALAGTKYAPDFTDTITYIEDVGERPYRLDRMFTQALQACKLHKAAAIVLGVFEDCQPKPDEDSLSLMEMLRDRLASLGMPVVYGLHFGHISNQMTLPYGIKAALDTEKRSITLLENAVV
jgi:muramoyltetrapeptide carboxypeptidase